MSAAALHLVKGPGLTGYNRQIQDIAMAVGALEDLMELQADALPEEDDRYLPVLSGTVQLLRLVRERLQNLGLEIAEDEARGAL